MWTCLMKWPHRSFSCWHFRYLYFQCFGHDALRSSRWFSIRQYCCMNKVKVHSLWYDSESLHGVRSKSKNNKTRALSSIECPQMHWDGDSLKENWHCFKQHVELMFSGLLKSRQEAEKCSCRLIWVGQKGRDICNMWTDITDENKRKLQTC